MRRRETAETEDIIYAEEGESGNSEEEDGHLIVPHSNAPQPYQTID